MSVLKHDVNQPVLEFQMLNFLEIFIFIGIMALPLSAFPADEEPVPDYQEAGQLFLERAADYADYRANPVDDLVGRRFTIDFGDGEFAVKHSIKTASKLTWNVIRGEGKGESATVDYEAFRYRPDIYYVEFRPRDSEAISLVLDFNSGWAVGVMGRLPGKQAATHRVQTRLLIGTIAGMENKKRTQPERTGEMAGRWLVATYAGDITYEHIYLDEDHVTWHGLAGPEAGFGDTERYQAVKLGEELYLVTWSEKVLTTQMTFVFDFKSGMDVGAIFGFKKEKNMIVHETIGARLDKHVRNWRR